MQLLCIAMQAKVEQEHQLPACSYIQGLRKTQKKHQGIMDESDFDMVQGSLNLVSYAT